MPDIPSDYKHFLVRPLASNHVLKCFTLEPDARQFAKQLVVEDKSLKVIIYEAVGVVQHD